MLIVAALLLGCATEEEEILILGPAYADEVLRAPGANPELDYGDPIAAINGVRGEGSNAGSMDVYSLGLELGVNDTLTLAWSGRRLIDSPGDDLIVFENPFLYSGGVFMDPVVVEVSANGADWLAFDVDYLAEDESIYLSEPSLWAGFAGLTPVKQNDDVAPLGDHAFELNLGGDAFDLADLPPGDMRDEILVQGACCIRLSSAAVHINPDTGDYFVRDAISNGADIDGVLGRAFVAKESPKP